MSRKVEEINTRTVFQALAIGRLWGLRLCEPKLKFIRQGFAVAKLKPGVIGVKVEIMAPDARLPDETDVLSIEEALKALPELADKIMPKEQSALAVAVRSEEEAAAEAAKALQEQSAPKVEEKKEASG